MYKNSFALCFILFSNFALASKPILAVLKFQDETGSMPMQGGAGRALTTMLTNELAARPSFVVVERQKIRAVLEEQSLAQTGQTQSFDHSSLGKLLGADYLITGTVTAFEEKIEEQIKSGLFRTKIELQRISHGGYLAIDLRVINVSTGAIDFARSIEGYTEGGVKSASQNDLSILNEGPDARAVRAATIEAIDYLECVLVKKNNCLIEFENKQQFRIEATKKSLHNKN